MVATSDPTASPGGREIEVRRRVVDVAVVGGGSSGRAAAAAARASGQSVVVLDSADGVEVVAAYAGPLVVARTRDGMLQVQASEVVVATGAAEIHPVCPGNELAGLLTAGAAAQLHAAGISVPGAVAIGTAPQSLRFRIHKPTRRTRFVRV